MDNDSIRQSLENEENRLGALRSDIRTASGLDGDSSASELSVVDQHPADAATDQQQREVDLSILEQVESELSDVERAMCKLDEGTYGKCEACQQQIEAPRLEASPATRYCATHAP